VTRPALSCVRLHQCVQAPEVQQADPLGSSMANITEVGLSLDYKLANIEETEAAKKRLLEASGSDSDDEGVGLRDTGPYRGSFPVTFGREREQDARIRGEAILKSKDNAFRRRNARQQ